MSMSKVVKATIKENSAIAEDVFKMCLKLSDSDDYKVSEPGQFINVYLNEKELMLPRPISICDHTPELITLVYAVVGKGTKLMSEYKVGTEARISTPLGKGFGIESANDCLLIGGGVGVPPMLYLAEKLTQMGQTNIRAMLGFRSQPFLADEFPCAVEISTDDGSAGFHGNIVELLEKAEISVGTKLFACGPKPMLRALAKFAESRSLQLQVSLEERMGCGYGACVGCTCKTIQGNRKVCEDGPVFDAKEVIWDG